MKAMSVFDHYVVDLAIRHNAAVKHARAIGLSEDRKDIAELTRLNVALIERIHLIADLVDRHGAGAIFAKRSLPMTPQEKAELLPP